MVRRILPILLASVLLPLASACLPRSVSTMLGLSQNLTVTGKVVTASGEPAADVLVFVGGATEAKVATDAQGQFSLTLVETDLLRLRSSTDTQRDTFSLFFQRNIPEAQVAVSAPIEQAARGSRHLGATKLGAPASFKGLVQVLGKGRKLEPAHEARVRVGRHEVLTAADGSFELPGLPSGRLSLAVTAKAFAPAYQEISLDPGESETSDEPIVLFEEPGIAGALIPRPDVTLIPERVASGHPYLQSFYVRGSRTARYLRMAVQEDLLESAAWVPLGSTVDFDFPSAGGHKLYYQFCDGEKTGFSPTYQIAVVINLFADSKGISINDGSGIAQSAQVMVNVDVPRAAFRMRYAESPEDLVSVPWGELRSKFLYVFESRHRTDFIDVEKPFQRNFYLQFEDATGATSLVFSTTVLLDLFSGVDFVIGDGSGFLTTRLAPILINLPQGHYEMRMADDYTKITDMPWLKTASPTTYLFSARLDLGDQTYFAGGPRTLKIQFRDAAHFVSPVYERPVYIDLFPPPLNGLPVFTVNFGSLYTKTRTVVLQINPPANAVEMQIRDPNATRFDPLIGLDLIGLLGIGAFPRGELNSPWFRVTDVAYYYIPFLDVVPSRTIELQFRDLDRVVSSAYQQPIIFDPFPPGTPLDARIVGGNGQVLDVELTPPPETLEYRIFDTASIPENLPWIEYTGDDTVQFVSTRPPGPAILTVQYKMVESAAVATVVTNCVTIGAGPLGLTCPTP